MKQHLRGYAEIDLSAIADNMAQLKKRSGEHAKMIAVIKADGYGHGAVPIARMFESNEDVWGYAVACMDEAMALRQADIQKPILILGATFPEEYEDLVRYEIRPTIYSEEEAAEISAVAQNQGLEVKMHIKIDTGMGRIGFPVTEESADVIRRISQLPNVAIEGLFTHFARADEKDPSFTYQQHDLFLKMKEWLERRQIQPIYLDCNNSAGIIDFPEMSHDLVRAGIALYGLYPSDEVDKDAVALKPALRLISHITFIKEVEPDTPISYGGTFVSPSRMTVATIPLGYADGYPRTLSNQGEVLIHGKRAKILGRVCMDQFMVDITNIPEARLMDQVVLIGQDGEDRISIEEISEKSGRFHYEIPCLLTKRVPRIYKENDRSLSDGNG